MNKIAKYNHQFVLVKLAGQGIQYINHHHCAVWMDITVWFIAKK